MNKARELNWWLTFGQLDLTNYREKALQRWRDQFADRMYKYGDLGTLLQFGFLDLREDFYDAHERCNRLVADIKAAIGGKEGIVFDFREDVCVQTTYKNGRFASELEEYSNYEIAIKNIFNFLLQGTEGKNFKTCRYSQCDNIFYPFSTKKKFFCSPRCATLAGQHGENK